jgi:hypothetical protein
MQPRVLGDVEREFRDLRNKAERYGQGDRAKGERDLKQVCSDIGKRVQAYLKRKTVGTRIAARKQIHSDISV